MLKISFCTGRNYGAAQVLEIQYNPETGSATFQDAARGINGRVFTLSPDSDDYDLGWEVLAKYDAGRYEQI